MPCATQYFPKAHDLKLTGMATPHKRSKRMREQATWSNQAHKMGEAQDVEREKQPINDRAADCAVQHKRILILNNANICISNIFDIFKWIFKVKLGQS